MSKYVSLSLLIVAWAMSGIVLADQGPPTIDSFTGTCRFVVDADGTRTDPLPCNPQEQTTSYSGYQASGFWFDECILVDGECIEQPAAFDVLAGPQYGPCFYNAPSGEVFFTNNVIQVIQPQQHSNKTILQLSCADLTRPPGF